MRCVVNYVYFRAINDIYESVKRIVDLHEAVAETCTACVTSGGSTD